jgi:hypothetical protein
MTISKNTCFLNNNDDYNQGNNIPNTCEFLIIKGVITYNLENLPILLKGIYFLNDCYIFNDNIISEIKNFQRYDDDNKYVDNKLYDPYLLPDCYIHVYSFNINIKEQIKIKVPYGCKVYNCNLEEIKDFIGYVDVIS